MNPTTTVSACKHEFGYPLPRDKGNFSVPATCMKCGYIPTHSPTETVSDKAWLYHPGLVNSQSGYTGRYRPAGIDKITGVPLIELEQVIKKENL